MHGVRGSLSCFYRVCGGHLTEFLRQPCRIVDTWMLREMDGMLFLSLEWQLANNGANSTSPLLDFEEGSSKNVLRLLVSRSPPAFLVFPIIFFSNAANACIGQMLRHWQWNGRQSVFEVPTAFILTRARYKIILHAFLLFNRTNFCPKSVKSGCFGSTLAGPTRTPTSGKRT